MFAKRVVLGAALIMSLVASPSVAFAGPNDNANAWVAGVAGENPGDCPSGYFCLYTKIYGYQGLMFKLYYCKEYDLHNWNGDGAFFNNNTGGAHALLQDRNYHTILDSSPFPGTGYYQGIYDFAPVWHVKACPTR